ncbi:hypothetical protein ACFE04_004015 [Oxalis oulophora]
MESMSIATLPSEIVYEILSRTSLETLKRSSILSKETNALTYESLFSNLHCQRTNTLRGVYLQGYRRGVYKGVFVSSKSRVPASISGTLNWLTTKGNIFSYDLHEDSSRFIELPNDGSVNNNLQLIDYEGKLGLNVQDREQHYCGESWVFSQNIWTRQHSINLKPLEERTCNILSVCNSDVVLVKYCLWAVAFYDFKKGITLRTQDLNHHVPDCAFHFESDFELFDLKRPTYTPTPDEKIRRQGKRTKTQQKEYGFSI